MLVDAVSMKQKKVDGLLYAPKRERRLALGLGVEGGRVVLSSTTVGVQTGRPAVLPAYA